MRSDLLRGTLCAVYVPHLRVFMKFVDVLDFDRLDALKRDRDFLAVYPSARSVDFRIPHVRKTQTYAQFVTHDRTNGCVDRDTDAFPSTLIYFDLFAITIFYFANARTRFLQVNLSLSRINRRPRLREAPLPGNDGRDFAARIADTPSAFVESPARLAHVWYL